MEINFLYLTQRKSNIFNNEMAKSNIKKKPYMKDGREKLYGMYL